ncbi:MAG: hypothetical protein N2748_04345, partial [candidate division WOR-3 bacterium]|nr:hypothetical protein [candidate division WOR-3 bacterium]
MNFKNFGLGVLLLFINSAWAIMPADWYYGQAVNFTDAQSIALAGNELFKPSVYLNNPLSKIISKVQFSVSYDFGFLQERRTRQVFDQFDNTVGEVAFVENLATNGAFGHLSILYPLPVLNLGFNISKQNNFDYYFYQEFRDDFYAKVGEEKLEVIGQLYDANLMIGKEFFDKLGVGVGLNYYFGSRKFLYRYQYGSERINADSTGKPNGVGFTAGFSFMPIDRLLIHLDYQSSVKLNKWLNDKSLTYPYQINLAVAYLAGGEIPTKIGINGQYTNWQAVNRSYQKIVEVGLGVEHLMFNYVALRYG